MDILNQALGVLGAVAPTIATAFGGPLAGQAVRWVEGALGLPQVGDKEATAAAVANATPDQLLALKKADQEFAVHLKELDVELEKIGAAERESARRMQVETRDWTPRVLAVLLTLGFFACLGWMLRYGLPKEGGGEALTIMLGYLGGSFSAIVLFYFGSSASSVRKDETIKALAR